MDFDFEMNDRRSIRSIIGFAVLLSLALGLDSARAAKASIGKPDFVLAVGCGKESSEKLCLIGKFHVNTKVTLLQSKACAAVTTSRGEEHESSGTYLTELDGDCEIPKGFSAGVSKTSVKDYKRLVLTEVVDPRLISKTAQLVRGSTALRELLTKAQDILPGDVKDLEGKKFRVYRVPLPVLRVLIAAFEASGGNEHPCGPRLLIINDRVYPLTGWCSYPMLNVFRLEGRPYIQSGSCCCGCGITIMELFRITPAGPVEAVSDGSLSD